MAPPNEPGQGTNSPALPGRTIVRDDFEDVLDLAGSDLFMHAMECVRSFGDFHLALSAGDLQDRLYVRLMVDPKFRALPWTRTHLWLVGEGACSPATPGSCYAEIRETLVDHAGLPLEQAHPIEGDRADGATAYEQELRDTLAWREPGHDRLDCVVLAAGGADFEGWSAEDCAHEQGRLVCLDDGRGVRLSPRLVNAARLIIVLASGSGGRGGLDATAGAALDPIGGDLRWYLDRAALPA
ncbi:MAG: 6-phosphogluconolactonase [Phycisphaerales bacterium]